MVLKHHYLSTVREEGSSPERPATPKRSSPPSASRSSLRRSQSSCQLDARQPSLLSRGSSPNLAGMHVQPDAATPSGREEVKRKSPSAPWQVLHPPCLQMACCKAYTHAVYMHTVVQVSKRELCCMHKRQCECQSGERSCLTMHIGR